MSVHVQIHGGFYTLEGDKYLPVLFHPRLVHIQLIAVKANRIRYQGRFRHLRGGIAVYAAPRNRNIAVNGEIKPLCLPARRQRYAFETSIVSRIIGSNCIVPLIFGGCLHVIVCLVEVVRDSGSLRVVHIFVDCQAPVMPFSGDQLIVVRKLRLVVDGSLFGLFHRVIRNCL